MENSSKLIVTILGQNCEKFIELCLESVKDADDILFIDGGSTDKTEEIVRGAFLKYRKIPQVRFIEHKWDETDKQMNGKQRNFYLEILKKDYPDHWCLVLDADEIVEDLSKIKGFIQEAEKIKEIGAYCVKMRHFVGDLGHEDATRENHWVPARLFRIKDAIDYPLHSHPILHHNGFLENTDCTTIWHLGHLPIEYMKYIVIRTKQHKEDSVIHEKEFLTWWGQAHLFGQYPKKQINPREIPELIYRHLGIDFEEIYSSQEHMEMKHPMMVRQWYEYFRPSCVLDLGCGRGSYLYFWQWFTVARGIEINKWAVKNAFTHDIRLGDITDRDVMNIPHSDIGELTDQHDLIIAIDVLEHLNDEQLDKALNNMHEFGRKFLFSIPFIGDNNLYKDTSHRIFKEKQWWIDKISSYGLVQEPTPEDWLFKEQILIFRKKTEEENISVKNVEANL